jgi:hypothetical protein
MARTTVVVATRLTALRRGSSQGVPRGSCWRSRSHTGGTRRC